MDQSIYLKAKHYFTYAWKLTSLNNIFIKNKERFVYIQKLHTHVSFNKQPNQIVNAPHYKIFPKYPLFHIQITGNPSIHNFSCVPVTGSSK